MKSRYMIDGLSIFTFIPNYILKIFFKKIINNLSNLLNWITCVKIVILKFVNSSLSWICNAGWIKIKTEARTNAGPMVIKIGKSWNVNRHAKNKPKK